MSQNPDLRPDPPDSSEAQSAKPLPARKPRWRLWCALVAAGGLITLLLTLGWLTGSQSGFATLWQLLSRASGRALTVEQVSGSLWQGFSLKGLHYQDRASEYSVESLRLDWQPAALWQRQLHLRRLDLGLVRIRSLPSAPRTPWPVLPQQLSLPLTVRLDQLHIAGISLEPGNWNAYALQASYAYDGQQHRLVLQQLNLPDASLQGQVSLAAQQPFAANGALHLLTTRGRADLSLSGNLQQLHVAGRARVAEVRLDLDGVLAPFNPQPFKRIQSLSLQTLGLDPHAIQPAWPHAALDIRAQVEPGQPLGAKGTVSINNRQAGPWSEQRLPLSALQAEWATDGRQLKLSTLTAQLGKGQIQLAGSLAQHQLALQAKLSGLALAALDRRAPDEVINGQLGLSGSMDTPRITAHLNASRLRAVADLALARQSPGWSVQVHQLQLTAGNGRLDVRGVLDASHRFSLVGALAHANPAQVHTGWPVGDVNADLNARGQLGGNSSATLKLKFGPSRLSGAPLQGAMDFDWVPQRLRRISADLNLAGNRLAAHGAYGASGDRLQLRLDAPQLSALGFGFGGSMRGQLDLAGVPAAPQLSVNLNANQLRLPGLFSAQGLSLDGVIRGDANGPFHLALAADQLAGSSWKVDSLRLRSSGSRARHSLSLESHQHLGGQPTVLSLQASGGWGGQQPAWRGVLQQASLSGTPGVRLLAPMSLEIGAQRQVLGAARFSLAGGLVVLDHLLRQANGSLQTSGRASGLDLAQLQPWLALPLQQNLLLDAGWNLAADGRGRLTLNRRSGDVMLDAGQGRQALGLQQAQLALDWAGGRSHFDLRLGAPLGSLVAQGSVLALPQNIRASTPLVASLRLDAPDLSRLVAASGADAVMAGALAANLNITGPLMNPGAHGSIQGHKLLWQDRKTGLRLSGGELTARLDGRRLLLDSLRFATVGGGEVLASGHADFSGKIPTASIRVDIRHFSVYDRPDRKLVVSGSGTLAITDRLIALTGRVRADQGRLSLPKEGTPALSDDVVVIGRKAPEPSAFARLPLSVALTLDLGDHFVLNGQGLNVTLSGQVEVKAHPGAAPSARGQVKVVKGSYKAYGQELDIESGSITFVGPLDNPNLDVRARRHLSAVGAGVEVLGPLSSPKLQLISTDSLSERDKLSWLVLGHAASDNAKDSNMLAIAASTLAAGRLNQQVGLFDDLGVARRESHTALNGTVSPAEQVLTVGRQLSRTFYLGYEYGLSSSQQAVKLMYQLSSKWSMVLRVGTNASAESRYTLRFD